MMAKSKTPSVPLKLIIIGGGYAGLSALITLRKQAPDAQLTLIDPRPDHLIITRLHETVHRSLANIQITYATLAKRFNFTHIQHAIELDEALIKTWNMTQCIQLGDESLSFDYLLVATGALSNQTINEPDVYDIHAISQNGFSSVLENFIAKTTAHEKIINIVGAGPTGIQFAFEIARVLKACRINYRLNLIDGCEQLLSAFPAAIGRYVEKRLSDKHISVLRNQYYQGIQEHQIVLKNSQTGECLHQASDLTLLLLGKKPTLLLHANSSGQVVMDQTVLRHIFTAGDCSHYDEMGSNLMTSQSALRKGKAAAKNMLLEAGILRFCLPYMHQDIGYLLSLGPNDAIGWIGSKDIIISGLPAFIAKEAIEAQYDLLLSGIDSYVL